jgi:hypothetical protein
MATDYQTIVDELRSLLQAGDLTMSDALQKLAQAFTAACQEVNQRLRRCRDLLAQGLRSEAIHLAQAEPNVLDLVALLDIPELSEWEEVLAAYGLPATPKLDLKTAEALNAAYAEALPLEALLRQHRLLALGRAAVGSRLNVLRRIATLDGENPIWGEDIPVFEKARHRELEEAARQAVQHNDLPRIAAVRKEIVESAWSVRPPASLVRFVENESERLRQLQAREQLKELETGLTEACAARDVATGRRLRRRLGELSELASLPRNDAFFERIEPALAWLRAEDAAAVDDQKFQSVLAQLQEAVDTGGTPDQLDPLMQAARAFQRPVPRALEGRYHSIIEQDWHVARRRRFRLAAVACAGVLLLAGASTLAVVQAGRSTRADEKAEQLAQLIDQNKLEEAAAVLEQVKHTDPALLGYKQLVEQRHQFDIKLTEHRKREEQFQAAMRKLEAGPLDSLDPQALALAKSLAKEFGGEGALQELIDKHNAEARRRQDERDKGFRSRLAEFLAKISRLEHLATESPDAPEVDAVTGELHIAWDPLRKAAEAAGASQVDAAKAASDQLRAITTVVEKKRRQSLLLESMTASLIAARGTDDYVRAAGAYLKEFPDTNLGRALAGALKEQHLWAAACEWGHVLAPLAEGHRELNIAEATKLVPHFQAFRHKYPYLPPDACVTLAVEHLEALAQRDEARPGAALELRKLFENERVKELWFLKVVDDNGRDLTYYTKNDPAAAVRELRTGKGESTLVPVIINNELTVNNKYIRSNGGVSSGPAAQSLLAGKVLKLYPEELATAWEKTLFDIVGKIADDQEMDSLLKLLLLKETLGIAGKGSRPAKQAAAKYLAQIDRAKNEKLDLTAPWIDPLNEGAAEARKEAARFLRDHPPDWKRMLKESLDLTQKQQTMFFQARPFLVGWLAREKSKWECRTPNPGSWRDKDYDLFVLVPSGEQAVHLEPIGRIQAGRIEVQPTASAGMLEGRLVFATRVSAR